MSAMMIKMTPSQMEVYQHYFLIYNIFWFTIFSDVWYFFTSISLSPLAVVPLPARAVLLLHTHLLLPDFLHHNAVIIHNITKHQCGTHLVRKLTLCILLPNLFMQSTAKGFLFNIDCQNCCSKLMTGSPSGVSINSKNLVFIKADIQSWVF